MFLMQKLTYGKAKRPVLNEMRLNKYSCNCQSQGYKTSGTNENLKKMHVTGAKRWKCD